MKSRELDIDYSNLHWGKYDSPIAQYITIRIMDEGDMGDEWESDGDGTGMARFGRRVQWWDDQGFVGCDVFGTVDDAIAAFARVSVDYYHYTCEQCGELVGVDEMSRYDHDKFDCEQPRPPRMDHNDNGSWFCNDCRHVVILFDDDEHFCEVTQTSSHVHAEPGGLLDEIRQAEQQLGTE